MVILSEIRMGLYRDNDHQGDALHFTLRKPDLKETDHCNNSPL